MASREYLTEALNLAKANLPGWAFALIHQAARSKAGGQISARNRRERSEKAGRQSLMIALMLPREEAQALAVDGGLLPNELHCTLASFGKLANLPADAEERALEAVSLVAEAFTPILANIGGVGRFNASPTSDGMDVVHASLDAPAVPAVREMLFAELDRLGLAPRRDHGFDPHITLLYEEPGNRDLPRVDTMPVVFPAISVVAGDERTDVRLGGTRMLKQESPLNVRGWSVAGTLMQVGDMGRKFFKQEANYVEPSPNPDTVCGSCRFFNRNPDGSERGWCQVVEGTVAWFGTSELYISAAAEARAVLLKQRVPTTTQTLIFDKEQFTREQAVTWAKEHDSEASKVDETEDSYRLRQREPEDFMPETFRTIELTDGVKAVIGRLKPELREREKAGVGDEARKAAIPSHGPEGAAVAFVGACVDRVEKARGEPFVGPVGETLRRDYLEPLELERDDVALLVAVPALLKGDDGREREPTEDEVAEWSDHLQAEITRLAPRVVIALGKTARKSLKGRADIMLPHPTVIRKFGDRKGELARKLKRVRKMLDGGQADNANSPGPPIDGGASDSPEFVPVQKADLVKQIVYGAVLDPYGTAGAEEDAHLDWPHPATIEEAAHNFLKKSRVVGFEHSSKANAEVVESFVVEYPPGERLKAFRGEAHKVFRRDFGNDVVHSGSWILGVQLGDEEWQAYQRGEINAFSPGGYAIRRSMKRSEMPKVEFVDLIEAPRPAR